MPLASGLARLSTLVPGMRPYAPKWNVLVGLVHLLVLLLVYGLLVEWGVLGV
jgi:hypothetical protein